MAGQSCWARGCAGLTLCGTALPCRAAQQVRTTLPYGTAQQDRTTLLYGTAGQPQHQVGAGWALCVEHSAHLNTRAHSLAHMLEGCDVFI